MLLEVQVSQLRVSVAQALATAGQAKPILPSTAILSDSFLTRAFAVWGHMFVANLVILIPIYLILVILGLSIGGLP